MKIYIIFFFLFTSILIKSQSISFIQAPGSPIANNSSQRGSATGDLNADGIKDLIVGNAYSSYLYVYLGLGNGQFSNAPGSPINVVNGPIYVAIADFNNDGRLDITTANYGSANVSVLLGVGNGSFYPAPGSPIATANTPYCVDVADFNLDGNKDIVTVNYGGNNIIVLLGNGTGSFSVASGSPINASGNPYHVSAGFYNSDNFPDFAIANGIGNTVAVYLGTGTGSFSAGPGSPYPVGNQPRTIAVKDLNNDNSADLVVTNALSNNIHVLLGSSNGSFINAPGSPVSVISSPYQSVIEDFNLDGSPDIATTNTGSSNLTFLYGNGSGGFAPAPGSPFSVGTGPQTLSAGDFNSDNLIDLAVGDWTGNKVTILLNKTGPSPCNLISSYNYTIGSSGLVSFNSTSTGTVAGSTYNWNFGDGSLLATGLLTSHSYSNSGTYTVSLVTSNNYTPACTATATQVITIEAINVGIYELSRNNYMNIFPNPTSGSIQIKLNQLSKTEIVFYNSAGELELKTSLTLPETSLNITSFKSGIHYYQLLENGKTYQTGQVILNKKE